jgi:hypothetical protein
MICVLKQGDIAMNLVNDEREQSDAAILTFDVSDDALEAAASTLKNPAFSMPNAPTVSIIFACCGNDSSSAPA